MTNKKWSQIAVLVTAALGLASCGGGTDVPVSPPVSTAPLSPTAVQPSIIKGFISDDRGSPVAGANVSAAGANTLTLADGSFQITAAAAGDSTMVLVKKAGYSTNAKPAPVAAGITTQIDIKLFADQITATFSAATGTTLAPSGAAVLIAPNAIQTAAGAAYTGTVTAAASYTNPLTVAGVQAFPEPYAGTDAGADVLLQSVGVIDVKLSDAAGNTLQLKPGSPATLTYPASIIAGSAGSIPLWYYDEALKTWVRDGVAMLQADGSYRGNVTHFTKWNLDQVTPRGTKVLGCFRNAAGQPVSGLNVVIQGTGWRTHGFSVGDANGNFESNVFSGIALELRPWATTSSFAVQPIAALKDGEVRQLPCLVVTPPAAGATFVVPSVTTIFVNPPAPTPAPTPTPTPTPTPAPAANYAGSYSGSYSGAELGTFSVVVSASGLITGTTRSITYNQTFVVSGQVSAGGGVSLSTSGSAGSATFTGSINAAGVLSGNWVYASGLTGGGTFSGTRNP